MNNPRQLEREIESQKPQIASYIARCFSFYCDKSAPTLFAKINRQLKDVIVFIVDDNFYKTVEQLPIIKTSYFNKLLILINQVKEMTGADLSYLIYPHITKVKRIPHPPNFKFPDYIEEIYKKYSYYFQTLKLDKEDIYAIYPYLNQNAKDKLTQILVTLSKNLYLQNLKNFLSNFCESVRIAQIEKKELDLQKKYGLNSLDELMDFHSKLQAFFINESTLNKQEKELLKENKKEIIALVGKNISLEELTKLNHQLEKILNNYFLKSVIDNPLVKDFLKNNPNLHLTAKQLISFYDALASILMGSDGVSHNEPEIKLVSWRASSGNISGIYVHEFIHSLEEDYTLNKKYRLVNELLTEHLTRVAIFNSTIPFNFKYQGYNFFNPILRKIANTRFFHDLLKARIENDFSKVIPLYKKELTTLNKLLKFAMRNQIDMLDSRQPNERTKSFYSQLDKFASSLKPIYNR